MFQSRFVFVENSERKPIVLDREHNSVAVDYFAVSSLMIN